MLYAFLIYARRFSTQAQSLLENITKMYMLKLHLLRIADIVFQDSEENQVVTKHHLPINGQIELKNISFRYNNNEPFILNDINLEIKQGECMLLVVLQVVVKVPC